MKRLACFPLLLALLACGPPLPQKRPAPAIRIATYNAYLLSPIFKCLHINFADCLPQVEGETEKWAHRLADTILADTDRFDIIAINEAWDEDAKDILAARLRPRYPIIVKKIDADLVQVRTVQLGPLPALPTGVRFNGEDSGLMLFAKSDFDVLPLPNAQHRWGVQSNQSLTATTNEVAFAWFEDCGSDDCFAAKGAALVRLEHRLSEHIYDVIFTHMQADYPKDGEFFPGVRNNQFRQIETMLRDTLDPLDTRLASNRETLLFLGDLNVPFLHTDAEWRDRFATAGRFFTRPLYEAWANTSSTADRSPTNSVDVERFDYIFSSREPYTFGDGRESSQCVQHMIIPTDFQALESDHFMVHADISRGFDHCSPAIAFPLDLGGPGKVAVIDQSPDDPLRDITRIDHPGAMQWVFVRGGGTGTYSIGTNNMDMGIDIYVPEDLTTPVARYNKTPNRPAGFHEKFTVDQYVLPSKFFIRVRGRTRATEGDYEILVRRHSCATKADPCILQPGTLQQATLSGQALPPGQLTPQNEAWFRFDAVGQADSGAPQTITLVAAIADQSRVSAALDDFVNVSGGPPLVESAMTNIRSFSGAVDAGSRGYLVVKQASAAPSETQIKVAMDTNLRFIEVGNLTCVDETNPELGSDDIITFFTVDSATRRAPNSGEVEFDCDDSRDEKPWASRVGQPVLAFVQGVSVRVFEKDDSSPDDPSNIQSVSPLADGKLASNARLGWFFEDGEYEFNYVLRRRPNAPVADVP